MNSAQFWYVKETHCAGQYNDPAEYSIFNGKHQRIVDGANDRLLNAVCIAHNKCFFDDEQAPPADVHSTGKE